MSKEEEERVDAKDSRCSFDVMYDDIAKEWFWVLVSGNGRPMAASCIGYKQRSDCTDAIGTFTKLLGAKQQRIAIVHKDAN